MRQRAAPTRPAARSPVRSWSASAASPAASRRATTSSLGGAGGMILYNPTLAGHRDRQPLPAGHPHPERPGPALLAFLASHSGVTATFPAGAKAQRAGRRAWRRSARAAARPDAGCQQARHDRARACRSWPAIRRRRRHPRAARRRAVPGDRRAPRCPARTSPARPRCSRSSQPNWTPGQIKSAIMTTAKRNVVNEDGTPRRSRSTMARVA